MSDPATVFTPPTPAPAAPALVNGDYSAPTPGTAPSAFTPPASAPTAPAAVSGDYTPPTPGALPAAFTPPTLTPGAPADISGNYNNPSPPETPGIFPPLTIIPDDHVAFVRLGSTGTPAIGNRAKPFPTLAAAFAAVEAASGGANAHLIDLGVGTFSLTLVRASIPAVILRMRGPEKALCSVNLSVTGVEGYGIGGNSPPVFIYQDGVTVAITSTGGIGLPIDEWSPGSPGSSSSISIFGGACSALDSPTTSIYNGDAPCMFTGVRFTQAASYYQIATSSSTYTQFYGCDLTTPGMMFGSMPSDMGGNSGLGEFASQIASVVAGLLPPVYPQRKTASFTAAIGGSYVTVGTFTISSGSEPSASQIGDSYTVTVASGLLSFTDGTKLAPSSHPVQRVWDGSAWKTYTNTNLQVIDMPNANVTLDASHNGKLLVFAYGNTITMPLAGSIVGFYHVDIMFRGATGNLLFAPGDSSVASYPNGALKLAAKYAKAAIDKYSTSGNVFVVSSPFLTV